MTATLCTKGCKQPQADEHTPLMIPTPPPPWLCTAVHRNTIITAGSPCTLSTRRKLWLAVCMATLFFITELVAGYFANSLALMSDAFHLLTDVTSFIVALFAIYLSERPPTNKYTFGFHRAEVIAAMVSVLTIWILTAFLVHEAILRLRNPQEIDPRLMCITASIGVAVNLVLMLILTGTVLSTSWGAIITMEIIIFTTLSNIAANKAIPIKWQDVNLNLRAASLHVLGDLLASVGVLLSSIVLLFKPQLTIVDPICTFIFAIIVVYTTFRLTVDSVGVLMESSPRHIQIDTISKVLIAIPGVVDIHDLHVWSLAPGKTFLTAHIVAETPLSHTHQDGAGDGIAHQQQQQLVDYSNILAKSQHILTEQLGINHLTLQIESEGAQSKYHCRPDLFCASYFDYA